MAVLADDAHHLLEAVSGDDTGAFVFGNSGGATTGLDLLARYPDQVRKLVAHEPPPAEPSTSPEQVAAMARMQRTVEFFLGHHLRPMHQYLPAFDRLPRDKLVIAVGQTSSGQVANRAGLGLAERLGGSREVSWRPRGAGRVAG